MKSPPFCIAIVLHFIHFVNIGTQAPLFFRFRLLATSKKKHMP